MDRDKIITSAFRLLGIAVDGEPLEQEDQDAANEALEYMLLGWQADGLRLWTRKWVEMPITEGKYEYEIGVGKDFSVPKPLRVLEVSRKQDSHYLPMSRLSEEEYWGLVNRKQEGSPINYLYLPKIDSGFFYIWPAPDKNAADNMEIAMSYYAPFENTGAGDIAFPDEWSEAIKYGLAVRLAPEYGLDANSRQFLKREFSVLYEKVEDWDREYASVYFRPDWRGGMS